MALLVGFPTGDHKDPAIHVEKDAGVSGDGVVGQQVALQHDNLMLKLKGLSCCKTWLEQCVNSVPAV